MRTADYELIKSLMPDRPDDANKGSMGTLYCVCGSYSMAGACILSARAALRCGVGLVKIATVKPLYPILAAAIPEAVFDIVGEQNFFALSSGARLLKGCNSASAVLVGCGIGMNDETVDLMTELIPQIKRPLLIDADGINAVARHIFILERLQSDDVVLTPHPKEMSRLTGASVAEIQADRQKTAGDFARKYSLTLLLKGQGTIIASPDGELYENPTGNSGLATGGSGDVLAGMIASLMAQGISGTNAAVCGAFIHGKTADILAQKTSRAFLLPSDIVESLYLWER